MRECHADSRDSFPGTLAFPQSGSWTRGFLLWLQACAGTCAASTAAPTLIFSPRSLLPSNPSADLSSVVLILE